MSLRWKYLIVVHSAILATAAMFVISYKLSFRLQEEVSPIAWAGVMVATLSVALLAAYHSFVAKPLRLILAGAERIARGDKVHRIDLRGGDELAAVASAMNEVAESTAKAHEELEGKVAERTEDLRAVLSEVHERSRIIEEVNRRLADTDRRKTEFLTNVSHELRTPLNSILGFLRLVLEGLYEDEDERREFLENARLASNHMSLLVSNVLSAARLESGRAAARAEPVHPGDIICDVVRMLEVQAREKGLALRIESDGGAMALADADLLRQLLVNLVGNALKFTDHGSVTIRARVEGPTVRLEVEDTGMGIPPAELERIFEKYHQVDNKATRRHGGAGLGLAIARELAHLMRGAISAHSAGIGKGSLFRLTLPAAAPAAAPA